METFDVIVIGAGPAGMMAAARAAGRGLATLLVEKNTKAGVKILMSGGTRCNLTHATDAVGIAAAFGRDQGAFLRSALARLDPEGVLALFREHGVATKVEPGGKVFPVSDSAVDVQRAMLRMVHRSGAILRLQTPVTGIGRMDGGFLVQTPQAAIHAAAVVVTVGGQSYPSCGTTGDGYAWAKALGHRIAPPRPALVPLVSPAAWVTELQGTTIADASVSLNSKADAPQETTPRRRRERETVGTARGGLLFTHFGLSGPAAMNASGVMTANPNVGEWTSTCDFTPAASEGPLAADLAAAAATQGRRALVTWVADYVPKRLAESLVTLAGVAAERRLAEVSRGERDAIIAALKRTEISVSGTLGFKKAEVTAGGVDLREVDSRTMESNLAPGLFFAGEILDLDGPIGGYNFQAAFSTGALAGESVGCE